MVDEFSTHTQKKNIYIYIYIIDFPNFIVHFQFVKNYLKQFFSLSSFSWNTLIIIMQANCLLNNMYKAQSQGNQRFVNFHVLNPRF